MSQKFLRRSATDLLQLAVTVCEVRFGVVRLPRESPFVSDPVIPLDAAERLALLADGLEEPVAVLDGAALGSIGTAIRFYAAVRLVDATGAFRGTLALLDERPRVLTDRHKELLLQLAAQMTTAIEMADVVQRSMAEQRRLQSLVDEVPVAVFHYGINSGSFSYVNGRFAQSLGYSVTEILELQSVTDLIPEDRREGILEMLRCGQSGGASNVRYVTKVRRRDGTQLDAEVRWSVADDVDGGRIVIGAALDVTTQLAATEQLREREEYFRALTDHVSDVIAIVSREGVLTYVSPSITRVLGHDPEELLGSVGRPIVHPDDQRRLSGAVESVLSGETHHPSELRFQHKSGKWRTLEVAAANLLDHPQIRGVVVNLHDITDRKRMENELRQLDRLTSLGRLAAHVAHEFNNVLMGIQPIIEVIRRRATGDPTLLRFTEVIGGALRRGKRITTDILRFAQPAYLTVKPIDVEELLEQAADEIRPLLGKRIELRVALDSPPPCIEGDAPQLVQVLINLALNARDAMEAGGGTLTLEARRDHDANDDSPAWVHFRISDTGMGIDASDLPHIFEPLFTTKQRGTGLGLSVVFQLVTAHRGRISVDSEPGKGTTFHLFIPAVRPDELVADVVEQKERAIAPRSLRVLLVEDDDAVGQGLRWSLEAAQFDVHLVACGADVLPSISAYRPDVMVLDLMLPDEDGRAVFRRVAAVSPIPVVFSSGHASEAEISDLLDSSHTAFLMKPYPIEDLVDAIHELVGNGREQS